LNILNKKIGIIGGGQLGKMMILEAKRLNIYTVTLDSSHDCPSGSISDELIVADFHNEKAIGELADKVDVITYEFEHINAEALAKLEKAGHVIYPSVSSLALIQDKFSQKTKLRENGVKVPDFERISSLDDLYKYAAKNGYPIMLKSCKDGYDGKGNYLIGAESDIENGFNMLGKRDLMVEEFINFDMELSVIATRGIDGKKVIYPIAHNVHADSILDTTTVCSESFGDMQASVYDIAEKTMEIFDGIGTFCVEMFISKNTVYVNEVAPRPHNSGHYTIEGCRVNQFENHIRAILGLPLGDTRLLHGAVIMRNLLGQSDGEACADGVEQAYNTPGVNVHIYGKPQSKKGRKMGHYTVTGDTLEQAREKDEKTKNIVRIIGL